MQAPKTPAGLATEDVMMRVKKRLPMLESYEQHQIYSAVLESMQLLFFEDEKPSLLKGTSHD